MHLADTRAYMRSRGSGTPRFSAFTRLEQFLSKLLASLIVGFLASGASAQLLGVGAGLNATSSVSVEGLVQGAQAVLGSAESSTRAAGGALAASVHSEVRSPRAQVFTHDQRNAAASGGVQAHSNAPVLQHRIYSEAAWEADARANGRTEAWLDHAQAPEDSGAAITARPAVSGSDHVRQGSSVDVRIPRPAANLSLESQVDARGRIFNR